LYGGKTSTAAKLIEEWKMDEFDREKALFIKKEVVGFD